VKTWSSNAIPPADNRYWIADGEEVWKDPSGRTPDQQRVLALEAYPDPPPPEAAKPIEAPPPLSHPPSFEEIFASLQSLVGLDSVKGDLMALYDAAYSIAEIRKAGGTVEEMPTLHMAFLGNPGTGKTTVARLCGAMFRQMGFLKSDTFIEVDRGTLVGSYIGKTEENLKAKIASAIDGVLFIDEAHALFKKDSPRDFGGDAVNLLVKAMEDQRHRLVVILAGYSDEMQEFLSSNSGLRSRIGRTVEFPDYGVAELVKVFEQFAEKSGWQIDDEGLGALGKTVAKLHATRDRHFGNARDMRRLLDRVRERHGRRLRTEGADDPRVITASDFPEEL
jgi:SpoVK/Ycf46/Vps4 family AAA+-type ATPase